MMILIYIGAFISILFLIVIVVDGFIAVNEWQQRIHIGRWNDRMLWQKAIERKAQKWLKSSPTVKITDQDRFILWDILTGRYRSNTIQAWQDAGLLVGMDKEIALAYVKSHPHVFDQQPLQIDYALLAYVLKEKGALSEENFRKMRNVFVPFNSDNQTVPYRKSVSTLRFVDSIGLICPFLAKSDMADLALRQLAEFDAILFQGVYPPHAYNKATGLPLGLFDWSRGIGWYILALTEAAELPGNSERIKNLANHLLPLQKRNGGFGCMLFDPSSRFESSGTALIGLLFVKAFELTQDQSYLKAAFSAEKSLMLATRRNGAVDYAQGDTKGIGFYSTTFSVMPFAQGMTLYLSKRLNQYA